MKKDGIKKSEPKYADSTVQQPFTQERKIIMKMKFKELPIFWKNLIIVLISLTIILAVLLVSYIWNSIGSLISVMF